MANKQANPGPTGGQQRLDTLEEAQALQGSAVDVITPPAGTDLVKVRVRAGRVMVGRTLLRNAIGEHVGTEDKFAEKGDVIDMRRADVERLLARSFDGYPSHDGQPGKFAKVVNDSPIELVQAL